MYGCAFGRERLHEWMHEVMRSITSGDSSDSGTTMTFLSLFIACSRHLINVVMRM